MDTRNQTYEQVIVASKRAREPTPEGYRRIDVTSRATDIFKTCSPFFVGPVFLYNEMTAKNVENAWQFAKVYREFIGEDGIPTEAYFEYRIIPDFLHRLHRIHGMRHHHPRVLSPVLANG